MPTLTHEQKRQIVARLPLFSGLAEVDHDAIARAAQSSVLEARRELFHKGDVAAEVYIVVHGRLKAFATSPEGNDVVFSILGPGDMIGEIALLGETERTATIVAIDACQLLAIGRPEFRAFLESHPGAAIALLQVLARRIARLSELVEDTQFLNLPVRLAKKILELAESYGKQTPDGLRVELRLSQEEWGDLVGATRESVNKQLRTWTKEGYLSVEDRRVIIHRIDALERLADAVAV